MLRDDSGKLGVRALSIPYPAYMQVNHAIGFSEPEPNDVVDWSSPGFVDT